jgi:hypothetical protein
MTVDFLFIGLQEIIRVQTRLAQLSFASNISHVWAIDKLSFLLIIITSRVMNSHAEMSIKKRCGMNKIYLVLVLFTTDALESDKSYKINTR